MHFFWFSGLAAHHARSSATAALCSSSVLVNLVSPVSRSTVTKNSQSPSAGARAASSADRSGELIGPGVSLPAVDGW